MTYIFLAIFAIALSSTVTHATEPNWADWLAAQRQLPAEQALQNLQNTEAIFGGSSDYYYWLGVYLLETGAPPVQALEKFEHALMLDPNNAGALYDYGITLCQMGDKTSCTNILQQARTQFGMPPALSGNTRLNEKLLAHGEVRASLGYSTNYNRGPRSNSLDINLAGLAANLPLAENDRARAGSFAELTANAAFTYINLPQFSLALSALRREPRPGLAQFSAIAGELHWQYIPGQRLSYLHYRLNDAQQGQLNAHALHLTQQFTSNGYWSMGVERRQSENYPAYLTLRIEGSHPLHPSVDVLARIEHDLGQAGRAELQQTRASLGLNLKTLLLHHAKLDFGWRSQYAKDNNPYSAVFGERIRHSWQNEVGMRLSWPLNKTFELRSELRHLQQTSNLQLFEQRETQFTFGMAGKF